MIYPIVIAVAMLIATIIVKKQWPAHFLHRPYNAWLDDLVGNTDRSIRS